MKLDNLILVYDNNGIQCDGPITLTFNEDVNTKMRYSFFLLLKLVNTNVQKDRAAGTS